jgi:hypothetical protein
MSMTNSSHVVASLAWMYDTLTLHIEVVQLKTFGIRCPISRWHLRVDFLRPVVVVVVVVVVIIISTIYFLVGSGSCTMYPNTSGA